MARGRKAHKARKKAEPPKKDPAATGEKLVNKPAAKKPASTSAKPKPVVTPAVSAQKEPEKLTAVVEKPASKPPPPKPEPVEPMNVESAEPRWQRLLGWFKRS